MENWSLRAKLLVIVILGGAIPLIASAVIGSRLGVMSKEAACTESIKAAHADVDYIVDSVYSMVVSQQELLQQKVDSDLRVAVNELSNLGGVNLGTGTTSWLVKSPFATTSRVVELPRMLVGTELVSPDAAPTVAVPLVDKVKAEAGCACTVFQRMNEAGDMLRVLTNVEREEGTRAIGTYIPATNPDGTPNPVVQAVVSGKAYRGRAFLVNAWYIAAYEPIKDPDGQIIGMLFAGVPERSAKSLRELNAMVERLETIAEHSDQGQGASRPEGKVVKPRDVIPLDDKELGNF